MTPPTMKMGTITRGMTTRSIFQRSCRLFMKPKRYRCIENPYFSNGYLILCKHDENCQCFFAFLQKKAERRIWQEKREGRKIQRKRLAKSANLLSSGGVELQM